MRYARHACRETHCLRLAKLRGVTFVNQYVVIKYLGKGANGRVFLCLDMCDNRLYAVKVGHRLSSTETATYECWEYPPVMRNPMEQRANVPGGC